MIFMMMALAKLVITPALKRKMFLNQEQTSMPTEQTDQTNKGLIESNIRKTFFLYEILSKQCFQKCGMGTPLVQKMLN